MWLTRVAIERRVTISMVILALIVLGYVGLTRMAWDLNPDVDIPIVSVSVPYPGAGPQEIEQRILRPLEDAVSVISGVEEVESTARENVGTVAISFDYGVDIDVAAADVRDATDRARALFPSDAEQASLFKIDIGALPIFTVGITGDRAPRDLRRLVDDQVVPRLGQVSGVAAVNVSGGEQREIQVLAYKDRLDAVGLSISHLAQLLAAENLDVPAGSIKEGRRDYAVRILGQFESIDQIRELRLHTPTGGLVTLGSVAQVQDTVAEPDRYARLNNQNAVTVSIIKQSGANTVTVARGVRRELENLLGALDEDGPGRTTGELPADLVGVVAWDSSEQVIEAIRDVFNALIWGAALASLIVFVFLHNFRATLIVALSIPTSIIPTFIITSGGFGFTLNTMVLLALALSVGTLVDNSIVVIENIMRHLRRGSQPREAAFNGRTELGGAAVGITLVDVVVYIPVALMGGVVGQFFFPWGITAFSCTMFSLFICFTLAPMLASWWFTRQEKGQEAAWGFWSMFFAAWNRGYEWLEGKYRGFLRHALRRPYVTVGVGYAALVVVFVLVGPRLGFEFFPSMDSGSVAISVESAVGTRLEETDRLLQEIETRLQDKSRYPEIEHVTAVAGTAAGGVMGFGATGGQYGRVSMTLSRRRERVRSGQRSDQELSRDLRGDLADLPGALLKIAPEGGMGGGGGADVELNILAEDMDLLARASTQLMHKISQIPGLLYVDLSAKPGRPEVVAQIDRLRASDLGLSVAEIGMAVRTAIAGDTRARYREGGEEYDLRVQLVELDRDSVQEVGDLFVGLTHTGQQVRLRDVATVYMSTGPSQVERYNRQRKVTLSATLDRSIILSGAAQQAINELLAEEPIQGVSTEWVGSLRMQQDSFRFLVEALLLAIVLVYIIIAALYNSVLQPMNVMLTLPMALVGALLGLWITGNSISVVAMVGFIMLTGLVGKNAILVVDYTNTLRARGMERTEALLEAGPTRMRPVFMTALATVFGMMPTALAVAEGSEWRAPMAIAVIFGLLLATVLTLIVVPATYAIWDQVEVFMARVARGLMQLVGMRFGRRRDNSGAPPDDLPPAGDAPPSDPSPGPSGAAPAPSSPGPADAVEAGAMPPEIPQFPAGPGAGPVSRPVSPLLRARRKPRLRDAQPDRGRSPGRTSRDPVNPRRSPGARPRKR